MCMICAWPDTQQKALVQWLWSACRARGGSERSAIRRAINRAEPESGVQLCDELVHHLFSGLGGSRIVQHQEPLPSRMHGLDRFIEVRELCRRPGVTCLLLHKAPPEER